IHKNKFDFVYLNRRRNTRSTRDWSSDVCSSDLSPVFAQSDFQWKGRIAPGQAIEIKGVNGGVHAAPANSNEVEVTAVRSARRSNPADVRIEVVPHSGGVTICAVYPDVPGREPNRCEPGSGGHSNTRNNDVNVDFTVRVPTGVAFIG